MEQVLAGSIRREMALEDHSAKQAAEIMQLERLVLVPFPLFEFLIEFIICYVSHCCGSCRSNNINMNGNAMQ